MSEARPSTQQVFTVADVSPDDTLSDLDKLCKYIQGTIPLQRLVYVKRITDISRDCGFALTKDKITPLLEHVCKDTEHVVRQALAAELESFADRLLVPGRRGTVEAKQPHDGDDGYQVVINTVLPCLHVLLADVTLEVRDSASQSLLALAPRLKKEDLDKTTLSPILQLVSQDRTAPVDDEQKASAIAVLNELSPILGEKLTREKIVPEIVSLSQDPSFRVRKACAQNYGNLAKTVGAEFAVSKLLPSFVKLSNDSIWSVRKGCVESIVSVAEAVDKDVRRNTFLPMITRFTNDVSRWVRNSAFRYLGPFIFVCEPDLVSAQFLELFTGIPRLSSAVVDGEVNFFCAYNFPAVVARLGPGRWPELSPTFRVLCRDTKFKVRKTLAHSLHEIAAILGSKIAEEDLKDAFDLFLKDLDEVRIGIITSIGLFLRTLTPNSRVKHIETLRDIQRESDQNWRFRELMALQIEVLAELYPADILATEILPIALSLVCDRIAAVRQVAVQKLGCFVNALDGNNLYPELLQELHSLGVSTTFSERQLYIRICDGLAKSVNEKRFANDFLPLLTGLTKDKVPNVRIMLARHISQTFATLEYLRKHPKIRAALFLLKQDTVRDVSQIVRSIPRLDEIIGNMNGEDAEGYLKFTLEMDFLQLDFDEKRD
eukprot:TRINITY_DN5858_c0_g1_i1.p2 TRINITY_DN5858_c0_g1~~TRINITY_DN5858_c0_g1_i1.p2  ORF type:complete len:658 (-),score=120.19 TRINITY_DN5858_c0_g1_i1:3867-5840(-)